MSIQEPSKRKRSRSSARPAAAEQVISRNLAVSSIYRKLIGLSFVATLAALVAVVAAVSLSVKRVPPQFVPVLADGRLLPLIPLDTPNTNQAGIAAFTLEAIRALNTYDYINWIDQINAAQQYFSPGGWSLYEQELMDVATMRAVAAKKMVVSVKPTGDARVVEEGKAGNGVYAWRVEVPIVITYTAHVSDGSGWNEQKGVVSVTISRAPTTGSARGLAIQLYKFTIKG